MTRQPTQRERVLRLLQDAGSRGVRTNEFLSERLPRFAARLHELRQRGYVISTGRDTASESGKLYVLVGFSVEHVSSEIGKPNDREVLDRIARRMRETTYRKWPASMLEEISDLIEKTGRRCVSLAPTEEAHHD